MKTCLPKLFLADLAHMHTHTHTQSFTIIHFVFSSDQLVVALLQSIFRVSQPLFAILLPLLLLLLMLLDFFPMPSVSFSHSLFFCLFQHAVWMEINMYTKSFGNICIQDAHFYRLWIQTVYSIWAKFGWLAPMQPFRISRNENTHAHMHPCTGPTAQNPLN